MNSKMKEIGTGIGIASVSIAATSNFIPGLGACTGTCGACGLSCIVPIVSISSVYLFSTVKKKFKIKHNKL
ncbi:hypothetical protein CPAST_c33760 [Clostridium pasteurianum DSM 525 = ATCC 6013]|uniref:Uncharacterized protein n=1 Tax=Clostridium pasteurianum DSM 525 = ATCC 6013 TaxID=1262449 RepID=A0A0H3J8A0_CLOPA|nr:hypothetical protein [Clostridium pasteurianum]AJA49442.1 hypothetical protein CPAST_c33760 [Clostridium pasteurianum DSM 525 = ATCC 6013]AJA53430.1 hypothetical protein CLPA_c33760 [Clostridium pasteurianum DSM 525 = ATCC 6013]AOZ76609.1 hypothetical protein AQ983_16405 [Clostridium pasteurianum DSM 525 = ATCC 6013]AOZ80406.1 hypothetical protein AQ984_16400 [Clostridium pasteurianum]ELP58442.1 hypothetical protein F502_14490 [Clostridium pasteurianum DSM 525 = ATCC 6013]